MNFTATLPGPPTATNRLAFRLLKNTDSDRLILFRLYADPEVRRFIPPSFRLGSVADLYARFVSEPQYEEFGYGRWLVTERATGVPLGTCGLKYMEFAIDDLGGTTPGIDLGYGFFRSTWGNGYATEACQAVMDWARQAGLSVLIARCLPEHIASIRVIEKMGFSYWRVGPDGEQLANFYRIEL
jgi:[ribosomal protein S5]-alanine N-acetyltransferase